MLPHEKTRLLLLNDLQSGGTALLYMSIAEQTVSGTNNKTNKRVYYFGSSSSRSCTRARTLHASRSLALHSI